MTENMEQPKIPKITKVVWPTESPSGAYYVKEQDKYTLVNAPKYQPAQYGPSQQYSDPAQLPNYEKLSGGERWITSHLPGFAESRIGKVLMDFGNSWAGKLLGYVDVLAEGLERAEGVGVQSVMGLGTGESIFEDQDKLKSAWYAGSLTADYANTTVEFGEDKSGKPYMRAPQDLPGAAGLVKAQQDIYNLTRTGMSYSDALAQVRAKAYEQAGALAIRMQMNDLVFHIFGDPLNIVAGWLKPVERIAGAKILQGLRVLPTEVRAADQALDVARTALREAEASGDAAKIATATEDVARWESNVANVASAVEQYGRVGPLGERFLRLSGQMPGELSWVEKLPKPLRWMGKLITLTPEARAYEYVDNIERNVTAFVINQARDPQEAVRALQRLASGTWDRQIAHMIVTPQGRLVRGVAEDISARATRLLDAYDATTLERKLLALSGEVLQDSKGSAGILARIRSGEKGIVALLMEKLPTIADPEALERLLVSFGHTIDDLPELFARMPEIFPDELAMYTDELFKLHLINEVADSAAQMGVKVFGIKSRGTLLAAADALKSAETLVFLRSNPAYPIMNWVNNNVTMIARGTFGTFSREWAEGFWRGMGFTPPRLRAGLGMSGEAENIVQDAIGQMARSAEPGSVAAGANKIGDFFKGVNLGKVDMGTAARQIEKAASVNAYTTGYLRGNSMFADGFTRLIRDFDPALAKGLGSDLSRAIEDTVRSSLTQRGLDKALLGENLAINMRSIMRGASERLNYNIDRVLTTEFTAAIEGELIDAARKGPQAITDTIASISGRMQQHLDGLVEEGIKVLIEETAAKVQHEGPGALTGLWGSITDEFYMAHPQHAENMFKLSDALAEATDPKVIDVLWRKSFAAEDAYFGRMWNRLEAYTEGMRKGGKALMPSELLNEVASNFRKWRSGWQGFFKWRHNALEQFFAARLEGKAYKLSWDQIVTETQARYGRLVDAEDQFVGRIDNLTAGMLDDAGKDMYLRYRGRVADWRRMDRELVQQYTTRINGLPRDQRKVLWEELWSIRHEGWRQIEMVDDAGKKAMAGNQEAANLFTEAPRAGALETEYAELNRKLWDAATPPEELQAIRSRVAEIDNVLRPVPAAPAWQQTAMMDLNELVPDQMYMGTGLDQLWFTRGQEALEAIGDSAIEVASRRPLRIAEVPEELMGAARAYIEDAKGGIASRQVASMQFGEFMRDSALLNYNRRIGFDTWAGAFAPYEFWFTHSIYKWVLHTLDRPAMLANYLRVQKFLETAYRPEANLPSRLRGSIRIHLPFLPDWMGDMFVDPLKMIFPFKRFAYPFEMAQQQVTSDVALTKRKLAGLVEAGQITQQRADEAMQTHAGDIWDRAMALARQDDAENRKDGFDVLSALVSPHWPIAAAYNLSKGREVGTVFPLTRTIGGLAGMLGIDPAGPYNPEAAIRKQLGLHPFDQWDDYRVDRELSDMAGDEEISIAVMQLAMNERGRAKDPMVLAAFQEATRRANLMWGIGAMGSVIGMPTRFYPSGEEKLREETDLYEKAWKDYEGGDPDALKRFNEQHPEYEARLALFKEPDERLRQFMVDQLWDTWNAMPSLQRNEMTEQLGNEFEMMFLNKETRGYDMIPLDTLQLWVSLIGGSVPGKLDGKLRLELAPDDIAWRAQSFYDTRNGFFPNWYEEQEEYYRLDEGAARRQYKAEHPLFEQYMSWRWDWLKKNPDASPYLTDEPPTYGSEAELQAAQQGQPSMSVEEWQATLGMPLWNLAVDEVEGDEMPAAVRDQFETIVTRMGFPDIASALSSIEAAERNILAVR